MWGKFFARSRTTSFFPGAVFCFSFLVIHLFSVLSVRAATPQFSSPPEALAKPGPNVVTDVFRTYGIEWDNCPQIINDVKVIVTRLSDSGIQDTFQASGSDLETQRYNGNCFVTLLRHSAGYKRVISGNVVSYQVYPDGKYLIGAFLNNTQNLAITVYSVESKKPVWIP